MSGLPFTPIASSLFNDTLGALFIGYTASAALFGINIAQVIKYFRSYKTDHILLRAMVMVIIALEILHSVLASYTMYWYAVSVHENISQASNVCWSLLLCITDTTLISLLVRMFFCYRIWRLEANGTRAVLMVALITILSFTILFAGIYFTVRVWTSRTFTSGALFEWDVFLAFGTQMAADTMIAAYMVVLLNRRKGGMRFSHTINIINELTLYSLRTGLLTNVIGSLTLITYAIMPSKLIYAGIYFVFCKCFSNSMLATLNARDKMRGVKQTSTSLELVHISHEIQFMADPTSD